MKKFVYVLFVVIVISLIGFCVYTSTPKYMMNKYVNAYLNNDCELMYSLTKSYNDLTNENNYVKACSKNKQNINDSDVDINKDYILVDKGDEVFKIKIQKDPKEHIGIDRYEVTQDDVPLLKNVILYVPLNSKNVLLNGTDISGYKVESDNKLYDKYEISYLYKIDYEIELQYAKRQYKETITFTKDEDVLYYEFDNEPIEITVFTLSTCPHCVNLSKFYDSLSEVYKNIFVVKKYDVLNRENENVFNYYQNKLDIKITGFPTSIIGDDYIQGYSEELEDEYLFKIFDAYRKNID